MTDLSMLFSTHLVEKNRESFLSQPKPLKIPLEVKLPVSSKKNQQWNLADLQSSLKKGIKKQVPLSSLSEEIQCFSEKQKQQYSKKVLIFGGIIFIIQYLFSLDYRITFHLILFAFVKFLPKLPFKTTQERLVRSFTISLIPVLYAPLFYYLMKWATKSSISEFNSTLTFTTVLFTALFMTVQYFQPIYQLSIEHLLLKNTQLKQFFKKVIIFMSYSYERIKFYKAIKEALVIAAFSTIIVQLIVLLLIGAEVLILFKLKNYFLASIIFICLQILHLIFKYIDSLFEQIKSIKNKTPVFLSLLRLEGASFYRKKIQDKCILNILTKMANTGCYLSTNTCKSIVYDTYMDIFSQCASIQLQRTQSSISNYLTAVFTCQLALNSTKKPIQDIFIYFRKLKAFFSMQIAVLDALYQLAQVIVMMRVIVLSDEQAYHQKETVRAQPRLIDILEMIQQKLNKLASNKHVVPFLRSQLMVSERKLSGWVYSMRKGWV